MMITAISVPLNDVPGYFCSANGSDTIYYLSLYTIYLYIFYLYILSFSYNIICVILSIPVKCRLA